MDDKREADSTDENHLLPTNAHSIAPAVGEVRKIHRRGGYFVGVAGWSGLLFWLIAKLSGFVTSGVVWAILLTLSWIVADETARTMVRSLLGASPTTLVVGDESRKFPLLTTDAYQQLPKIWKQLLAEVQLNQSKYPTRLVSTIRELTLKDIATLGHIAPYVLGNSIIHADDFEMGYDIPSVSDVDFERLKTIGITTAGQFGMYKELKPRDGKPARHSFRGTTLALLVKALEPTTEDKIHFTSLTEEGEQIMRLINKPTSLQGVCKIASRLKETKEITAVIYARFEPEAEDKAWSNADATGNVSSLCSRYGAPLQD